MKKTPLFYISPALLVSVSLIGIRYAALHSFLNKEWVEGVMIGVKSRVSFDGSLNSLTGLLEI